MVNSSASMAKWAIGLGSNLGDSIAILTGAINQLKISSQVELVAVSRWYLTTPIGPPQPDYVNACAIIQTRLKPLELLATLQAIEADFGRVRQEIWGARTLDLDLLLSTDQIIDSPTLQVPHPRMLERAFVLVPLAEIAPDWIEPRSGDSIAKLCDQLGYLGVELIRRAIND
jgi:2-amino-4-hydroxy-6-hydroxymethyldihydropteridine diphosphokinase